MAITVAQVEAILSIQTKGFDSVTSAIKQMSDNFDKSTGAMLSAINKLEAQYASLGKAAQGASKTIQGSSDDSSKAWDRQAQTIFKATEAFKTFAAEATRKNASSGNVLELEKELENLIRTMNAGALSQADYTTTVNAWTAAQNKANITLKDTLTWRATDIAQHKQEQAAIASTTAQMASQQNALLRAKNQYDSLAYAIQNNVANEKVAAGYTAQLTAAYQKLVSELSGPLNSAEMSKFNIVFRGTLNDISRSAGVTNGFQQQLSELGKVATLAAGPLSGIAARITAFAYLADTMSAKTALIAAGITAMGVAMTFSVKGAADFQTGLTRTAIAAGMTGDAYNDLSKSMLNLSTTLMIPTEELLKISQAAAQAGVSGTKNLTEFTRVVAELTRTTSLTADTAADSLLTLANVTKFPIEQISKLGDMITQVGQSSVGSESKVLSIATEVAKAGYAYGFTAEKAIAWAGALADTGNESEASSTAIVQSIQKMGKIVSDQGPAFHQLSQFIGMTDEQLTQTFAHDGPLVMQKFVQSLGQSTDSFERMKDLMATGIVNVRTGRVDSSLSTQWEKIVEHLKEAGDATGALNAKFAELNNTFNRQAEGVKTNFENIGIIIGNTMLGPLTSVLEGIRVITSATGFWADAFGVLAAVGAQFMLLWTAQKGIAMAKQLLTSTTAATVDLAAAQTAATASATTMATAEGVVATETATVAAAEVAATASTGLLATAFSGVGTAVTLLGNVLKAFWPILAVEAIAFAIGKLTELQDQMRQVANLAQTAGANKHADEIKTALSGGDGSTTNLRRKYQAQIDNARGSNAKLAGQHTFALDGSEVGGDDIDAQVKKNNDIINEYTGALKAMQADQKQAAEDITHTTMEVASKTADALVNGFERAKQAAADHTRELEILKTQGQAAYEVAKKVDSQMMDLNIKINKNVKPADQKGVMGEFLTKYQDVATPKQLGALSDALKSGDWNAGKKAILDIATSLATAGAQAEVTGKQIIKTSNEAAAASKAASLTLGRTMDVQVAGFKNMADSLAAMSGGDFATFQKILNSQNAAAGEASWMDKIKTLLPAALQDNINKANQLSVALGGGPVKSAADLAKFMYDVASATEESRRSAQDLVQSYKDIRALDITQKKNIDKLNVQTGSIGESPDTVKINDFKQSQIAGYVEEAEKLQNAIGDIQARMANSDNFAANALDANTLMSTYEQLGDVLTNKIPDASKTAGDAMKANLDAHRIIDPLISSMDTLRSSFVQFGTTAIMNFNSIGSAFSTMLNSMASAILENQVFGPLSDSLFGQKGGSGGGLLGGILGAGIGGMSLSGLLGGGSSNPLSFAGSGAIFGGGPLSGLLSFGGFKAGGGMTVPGKSYVVGENGPELFTPGLAGNISPNGMGGGGTIHIVLEASPEFNTKMVNISGAVANNVVMSYDKSKLPTRVSQLTKDPRSR